MKEEDIQLDKAGPQGLGKREMKRDEGNNCLKGEKGEDIRARL